VLRRLEPRRALLVAVVRPLGLDHLVSLRIVQLAVGRIADAAELGCREHPRCEPIIVEGYTMRHRSVPCLSRPGIEKKLLHPSDSMAPPSPHHRSPRRGGFGGAELSEIRIAVRATIASSPDGIAPTEETTQARSREESEPVPRHRRARQRRRLPTS